MIPKHPWLLATVVLVLTVNRLPAQDEDKLLYKSAYRVINVHRHCDAVSADAIKAELEVCDRVGVSAVVILDGGDIDGKVPAWMELKKRYPDRLIVFSNVPWGRIKRDSFFDDIVRELPAQQRAGIQGVKIFKQLGMSIKGPDGKLLRGDDPRLDPFWAKCGELGLPVLIHMADPKEYWYPLTYNSFHYGMKAEESQFYDRAKMPSWEDLIEQRNNILKKHPKTKFIGAHMGSLTFDLKQLGETFDKYPNFYVDCSARTRILGRLNPMAVRDFFTKYQDRILFGTDSTALHNVDPKDEKAVGAWKDRASRFYSRHLEFFETNHLDIVEPYGWGKEWLRIPGVKLPPEVLEKFYHANAEKLIPGVAKQAKMEPAEKKEVTSDKGGAKGAWNNLTDEFLKVSGKGDFRMALAADRTTGNLFVSRWTTGVWLSGDQGKTFSRVDGQKVNTGGPFSCHALIVGPEDGKLAVFNMNNKPGPSGYSLDRGKTWESFESVGRNWDYGAVDWDNQSVLALRHEHDGVHLSTDLGKTWTELDLKRGPISGAGVLSARDLVISRGGKIEHSPDGGKTWAKVADYMGNGPVHVFNRTGYWLANKREKDKSIGCILISTDQGKTWKELGKPMDDRALAGPCFGKNEKHIVVAAAKGILETVDDGESWKSVASYPADAPEIALNKDKYGCTFPSIAYDAVHDVFYLYFFNDKKWAEGQLLRYTR